MSRTFVVAFQQIKKIALHWSFLLVVLYPPLAALTIGIYLGFVAWASGLERGAELLPAPNVVIVKDAPGDKAIGLVDQAGLIETIPADLFPEQLLAFANEAAARAAVAAGQIAGYYFIPADYVANGVVTYFSPDNVQFAETDVAFQKLLTLNLALADGEQIARRVAGPVAFEERLLPLAGETPPIASAIYTPTEVGIGVGIALFVYFTVGSVCGMFLNQVAEERQGRVLEVVLGAITPAQLLNGKFIGIAVVGLIETGAWLFWVWLFGDAGRIIGNAVGNSAAPAIEPGPDGLALTAVLFVSGYFAYVATAAVFASIVRESRHASRINLALGLATLTPLIGLINVLADRDGPLAIVLSLFPLTAPVIMPLRVFVGEVPIWQIGLSIAALIGWTGLMLWLSARLFTARALLDERPLRAVLWQVVRQIKAAVSGNSSRGRSRA